MKQPLRYEVLREAIGIVELARPLVALVQRRDRDLALQVRRAVRLVAAAARAVTAAAAAAETAAATAPPQDETNAQPLRGEGHWGPASICGKLGNPAFRAPRCSCNRCKSMF